MLFAEARRADGFSYQNDTIAAGTVWVFPPLSFHALMITRDRISGAVMIHHGAGPRTVFGLIVSLAFS